MEELVAMPLPEMEIPPPQDIEMLPIELPPQHTEISSSDIELPPQHIEISSSDIEMPPQEIVTPPPPPLEKSPPENLMPPLPPRFDSAPILREKNINRSVVNGNKEKPFPVKVPPRKIFAAERYLSPTDTLVSPISKGLLARNRRPIRMFMPPIPPKALETSFNQENCASKD